ncbi:hypothetical protein V6Z12_A11G306100 [Gossypium hirsutum]
MREDQKVFRIQPRDRRAVVARAIIGAAVYGGWRCEKSLFAGETKGTCAGIPLTWRGGAVHDTERRATCGAWRLPWVRRLKVLAARVSKHV